MIMIDELKVGPKVFGRGKKRGPAPQGSRRTVVLSEGSELKWWKGQWIFRSYRENSGVASSLQFSSMSRVTTKTEKVQEVYDSEERFAKRMIPLMGYLPYMDAIAFLKNLR